MFTIFTYAKDFTVNVSEADNLDVAVDKMNAAKKAGNKSYIITDTGIVIGR